MNNIVLLQTISLVLIIIIAIIVVYQFVQQQQALNRIASMLNPDLDPTNSGEPPKTGEILGYSNYQECIKYWTTGIGADVLKDSPLTAEDHCEEYK